MPILKHILLSELLKCDKAVLQLIGYIITFPTLEYINNASRFKYKFTVNLILHKLRKR
jgi:hypothetical protein